MTIALQTFASGDTDYIAKLNSNVNELINTIGQMQNQLAAIAGTGPVSVGMLLDSLFNQADARIGPGSYVLTPTGTTMMVSPGGAYLAAEHTVAALYNDVPLSFIGKSPDTYYVRVDPSGQPVLSSDVLEGALYSVYWTGSAFGVITPIAAIFYDTRESDASRKSLALAQTFPTLDTRLEAGEILAANAKESADSALGLVYELEAAVGGHERKIGVTVDGSVGVKGAIQIDFDGVIIGWSVIADAVGSLQVEVSVKPSSPPPAVPAIPDPTTDKISASAPIALASAQSAARAESGVSTWMTALAKWDVVQFKVASVTTITRATLYLRIQEILPSPPMTSPLEMLEFREGDA